MYLQWSHILQKHHIKCTSGRSTQNAHACSQTYYFVSDRKDTGPLELLVPGCNENKWDKDQYCACNKWEKVWKFSSHHSNYHEDRKWTLSCKPIVPEELRVEMQSRGDNWMNKATERNNLDQHQEWNGLDSNSFLVGMQSHHDNGAEDRMYSFFTARSDNFVLDHCTGWRKLNKFDKKFDLVKQFFNCYKRLFPP